MHPAARHLAVATQSPSRICGTELANLPPPKMHLLCRPWRILLRYPRPIVPHPTKSTRSSPRSSWMKDMQNAQSRGTSWLWLPSQRTWSWGSGLHIKVRQQPILEEDHADMHEWWRWTGYWLAWSKSFKRRTPTLVSLYAMSTPVPPCPREGASTDLAILL